MTKRTARTAALTACTLFLAAGCSNLPTSRSAQADNDTLLSSSGQNAPFNLKPDYIAELKAGRQVPLRFGSAVPKEKVKTDVQALTAEGMGALSAGKLETASELFNTALRLDLGNSSLQFMNALTYHLMALNGDAQKFALAEQGYTLAYKFDPTSVLPMYYQGLALIDQRKFDEAKNVLALAAVMEDADAEVLYDLARAAYYSGDPRTAMAALHKLSKLNQSQVDKGKILRASIVSSAALGDMATAKKMLTTFKAESRNPADGDYLSRRINAWERVYASAPASLDKSSPDAVESLRKAAQGDLKLDAEMASRPLQLAQLLPQRPAGGVATIPGAIAVPGAVVPASLPGTAGVVGSANSEMTVVDVVIVGTQEDVSENKGLNLLSGLQLQFGDPLTRVASFTNTANRNIDAASNNTTTRSFTRFISIPAVNYSLNIFNTLSGRNEILARPSLVALANERSEFFSGVDVIGAAVSGGDGAPVSINKQIGVKLSIVPEFLSGDRIKLKVEAERTFITSPSRSVEFNFRLDTSKTTVNANVVMRFGETLVLGGLTEKDIENNRDATPILGDIPIIQYLFARKSTREFRKSVLIMLTPRRAQFANQSAPERAKAEAGLSDFEKSLDKFEERNKNWFVPKSVMHEAMGASEGNTLFQEFKTGDFMLERWNARDTHEQRLRAIKDFIFY
jgi:tetratricopeptide (TPR) repeat protein